MLGNTLPECESFCLACDVNRFVHAIAILERRRVYDLHTKRRKDIRDSNCAYVNDPVGDEIGMLLEPEPAKVTCGKLSRKVRRPWRSGVAIPGIPNVVRIHRESAAWS